MDVEKDDKVDKYRLEKLALLKQATAHKGNTVAINEIADVTIVRAIPLMAKQTFREKFRNFQAVMHRPPHPWEECSIYSSSPP